MSFVRDRLILPAYIAYTARLDEDSRPPFALDAFSADWARGTSRPNHALEIPKRIFMLWDKGHDAAPAIVKAAHASWVAANPGWDVVFLDATTVSDWVDISDLHPDLWMAARSDVIRLRLLSQYGGVWVDSTVLCMHPLDDWLGRYVRHGFFQFAPASRTRATASWFMAGRPGAPLLEVWQRALDGYIRNRFRTYAYFFLHHIFEYCLATDSAFRAVWADTPKLHADGPHMLKRILTEDRELVRLPTAAAMAEVPLFKLNHRPGPENLDNALHMLAKFGLRPRGEPAEPGGVTVA